MKTIVRVVVAVGLLGSGAALAAGDVAFAADVEAGAAKAAVCGGCHGPSGISVNGLWPNLAGQHVEYLDKQIKAFRDGSRAEPTMAPFVATLSDSDITDIAAFYASRKVCQ